MKITIQGQDYTSALDAAHPLTIKRHWAEPAVCNLALSLPADGSVSLPARNQSLAIDGDNGIRYFDGYIAVTPLAEYSGLGLNGLRYRLLIEAVSGDILLNAAPAPVNHPSSPVLTASQYRGSTGTLISDSVAGTVHDLEEATKGLEDLSLSWSSSTKRMLANDFTVCGDIEPTNYVTEFLQTDGTSLQYFLSDKPFFRAPTEDVFFNEPFMQSELNAQDWSNTGSPGYLALGSGGLALQGGRGTDGTTMLTWNEPVEMGGTLLLEAKGVSLQSGSSGLLTAFYSGVLTMAGCIAGFQASADPGSGAVTIQPVVNGLPLGTTYSVNPSNQYALRIRVHCGEMQRVLSIFRAFDGTTLRSYGGDTNQASAMLLFEVQEFVNGVAGMPVVLYDGSVTDMPSTCTVAAVSSINLQGSIRSLLLESLGTGWVTTTPSGGTAQTRRIGTLEQVAECQLDRSGRLVFFSGFAPPANSVIAVSYRASGRSVGRSVRSASQAELTSAGLPNVSAWQGTVTSPAVRSSQDSRNAAHALADAANDPGAVWNGSCTALANSFVADVNPGDAVRLNASSSNYSAVLVAETVEISYTASYPDIITYRIAFANDWAGGLGIRTTENLPTDVLLPAANGLTVLPNLSGVSVTSISGATVTIDTGAAAPAGGGFEIRKRDNAFGLGETPDLVLRASTSTMSFSRTSATDRFYIRMYDDSAPPNYSEFSAALFFNMPLGS